MNQKGITYDDIKNMLSPEDLAKYNEFCRQFARLVEGKNNKQLWEETEKPCELTYALMGIHKLMQKYNLIVEGKPFFKVWKGDVETNRIIVKSWG
ncbi:MAG: hypothetical protein JW967_03465 [Dehalococcoidales bacterium]|nr:hypothetical protein [Dehalococcoidales bacterium]